jgi:hypothetical protein
MKLKNSIPPSRQGKKQVITYVSPDLGDAVRKKAEEEGKTLQEMLAEAMNAVCEIHDMPPIFKTGHKRIVKRKQGQSKIRSLNNAPSCRTGRKPIGGWFKEEEVRNANHFSNEISIPIQKILEIGLKQITGIKNYKGKL